MRKLGDVKKEFYYGCCYDYADFGCFHVMGQCEMKDNMIILTGILFITSKMMTKSTLDAV